MKVVQPIRDLDVLDKCYAIARAHDKHRKKGEICWELLLVVGFNTSLRISDLRRFRVNELRDQDYAQIKAKKTGKEARILINPPARRVINRLLAGRKGGRIRFPEQAEGRCYARCTPHHAAEGLSDHQHHCQGSGRQGARRLPHAAQDVWISLL